ncbi:MAG: Ig-like domain-containing protein [Gemmatimonadaceae bacterium]|nr:Ig-like domain-containing protein [Gemmatimonadaceae bacterium]
MRLIQQLFAATALATLVACGGSSDTTSPPITPPAATVTLSVLSGDGQEAVPGTALANNPVVVARSAAGTPVSGIAVTFAIDSGGGVVATTSATTGADGTVSPGRWTLGASEGANVLTASAIGSPTIRLRSLASFPVTALITNATVPRSGAVLTVNVPGDPLNGLKLTIPDTALGVGALISIGSKASKVTTLPAGYAQVGPTIVISNSVAMSSLPMVLTIPVNVQSPDTALAAFYHDPLNDTYEVLPVAARTATTLSVFARHFTADRLMRRQGATKIARREQPAGARVVAGYSPAQIIVASVPAATLSALTTTGFAPGVDDWEFENLGTLPEDGGICAGMSISAMYYFYAHSALGPLFRRFNPVGRNNNTNTVGLRFATVAQRDMDWASATRWFDVLNAMQFVTAIPAARLHYQTLVMAMRVTHLPQFLDISGDGFEHAVIAFASNNGAVSFADPNAPGVSRTMTFTGNAFAPFPFSARAGAANGVVTGVKTIGASAMLDAAAMDAEWSQVADSTIGNAIFTQVIPESYDRLTDTWSAADTTKTFYTSDPLLTLRTMCPNRSCPVVDRRDNIDYIHTRLINASGTVTTEGIPGADGASFTLAEGQNRIGVIQHSGIEVNSYRDSWTNFRWMNVVHGKVSIIPARPTAKPDSAINFSVSAGALQPIITRYTWDFGDGTAVVTTTTPAAAHAFARAADFKVLVKLYDAANRLVGKDSTAASISVTAGPYSVWKVTTSTSANINPPPASDTGSSVEAVLRRRYDTLVAYWGRPRSAVVNPTLWVVKTASPFNNDFDTQPIGVYLSDSLPGTNGGKDPYPAPLALAADVNRTAIDTPEFLPKWTVTGTVPDDGHIIATGALRNSTIFACIGEFTSATFVQAVDFRMSGNTGTGTITYTFRVVRPSCNRPNQELSRWQWVVSFTATRIK